MYNSTASKTPHLYPMQIALKFQLMKRISTLLTLLLFAGLLLPSCGVTVKKRQHTNGYYVNINHRNHGAKADPKEMQLNQQETTAEAALPAEPEEEALAVTVVAPVTVETTEPTTAVVDETPALRPADAVATTEEAPEAAVQKTERTPLLTQVTEHMPLMKKVANKVKSSAGMRGDGDGLSLFWIVILVLLILWALGVIGGGWGLGGLIYILLVIALILLILWLLRVV